MSSFQELIKEIMKIIFNNESLFLLHLISYVNVYNRERRRAKSWFTGIKSPKKVYVVHDFVYYDNYYIKNVSFIIYTIQDIIIFLCLVPNQEVIVTSWKMYLPAPCL